MNFKVVLYRGVEMFTCTVKTDLLKTFLEAAQLMRLSVPLNFQPDKIICDTIDIANTELFSGVVYTESMEIDYPEIIMLELSRTIDVLSKAGGKDSITSLTRIDGGVQLELNRIKYTIRESVDAHDKMGKLNFNHPVLFNLETSGYISSIGAIAAQSSTDKKKAVYIIFSDNQFVLQDRTDDPITVTWEEDELSIIKQDNADMHKCVISLDYLKESASVLKIFDTISINMKTDSPFIIRGENDKIKLGFIIAPRIES